jgi:hypothetical protein
MLAETQRGTETRSVVMDFGFTPEALVNNVDLVGIDPTGLDALVLSHGWTSCRGSFLDCKRHLRARFLPRRF